MKRCTKCKQMKSCTNFYRRKDTHDGLRTQCKDCMNETAQTYAKGHRESINSTKKKWRENNLPKQRFLEHKWDATMRRGIEFLFTFEEWWAMWEDHWDQRGTRRYQLCMGRKGDVGPYSVDNVEIITNSQNNSDQYYYRNRAGV